MYTATTQKHLLQARVTSTSLATANDCFGPVSPWSIVWSTIELGTAIIRGCLPTYGPLLQECFLPALLRAWFALAIRSVCGSRMGSANQSSSPEVYRSSEIPSYGFYDNTQSDNLHEDRMKGKRWMNGSHVGSGIPLDRIYVERRVEVV